MANAMTRQKVWENNVQKQAVMSFLADNGITDVRASANGIEVSKDKGVTWTEISSVDYVKNAITNAKPDILASQLPQIEKVWWVDDGETTTIYVQVSQPLPDTLTVANCVVYDAAGGNAITVLTITKIDAQQFSVVTEPFGVNKSIGVYYEK